MTILTNKDINPNQRASSMSEKINRIIKSAEKAVKFGDFQAAKATCHAGLEKYPNTYEMVDIRKITRRVVGNM